jgi:hypothetical protein
MNKYIAPFFFITVIGNAQATTIAKTSITQTSVTPTSGATGSMFKR